MRSIDAMQCTHVPVVTVRVPELVHTLPANPAELGSSIGALHARRMHARTGTAVCKLGATRTVLYCTTPAGHACIADD